MVNWIFRDANEVTGSVVGLRIINTPPIFCCGRRNQFCALYSQISRPTFAIGCHAGLHERRALLRTRTFGAHLTETIALFCHPD